jgi:hypothetical protein
MLFSAFSKSLAFRIVFLAASVPANASTFIFQATLVGTNEIPANASTATGSITATLDDVLYKLAVSETFSNLTTPASAAHIHCCAVPHTINAPVVLPFTGFPAVATGTFN